MLPSVQLGRFHLHRNVHSDSHGSNSSGFVAYACQEAVVLRTACVTRSKLYYGYALAILILGVSDRSGALLQKRFGIDGRALLLPLQHLACASRKGHSLCGHGIIYGWVMTRW